MAAVEVKRMLNLVPELLEVLIQGFGHLTIKKLMFFTLISRSQVMQMIPNSRMMTS